MLTGSVTQMADAVTANGTLSGMLAMVKDVTIHQQADGRWPVGFRRLEAWADCKSQPGRAIIKANTVVQESNVPTDLWAHWVQTQKLVPVVRMTVLLNQASVKKAVQLIQSARPMDILELSGHGGFNVDKNLNAGVTNVRAQDEEPAAEEDADEEDEEPAAPAVTRKKKKIKGAHKKSRPE